LPSFLRLHSHPLSARRRKSISSDLFSVLDLSTPFFLHPPSLSSSLVWCICCDPSPVLLSPFFVPAAAQRHVCFHRAASRPRLYYPFFRLRSDRTFESSLFSPHHPIAEGSERAYFPAGQSLPNFRLSVARVCFFSGPGLSIRWLSFPPSVFYIFLEMISAEHTLSSILSFLLLSCPRHVQIP